MAAWCCKSVCAALTWFHVWHWNQIKGNEIAASEFGDMTSTLVWVSSSRRLLFSNILENKEGPAARCKHRVTARHDEGRLSGRSCCGCSAAHRTSRNCRLLEGKRFQALLKSSSRLWRFTDEDAAVTKSFSSGTSFVFDALCWFWTILSNFISFKETSRRQLSHVGSDRAAGRARRAKLNPHVYISFWFF